MAIPAGAPLCSDSIDLDLPALSDFSVSIQLEGAPADLTTHPGARTTSKALSGSLGPYSFAFCE